MSFKSFEEIIRFAIQKELSAMDFYISLQDITKFSPIKQVLHDFEKMEENHVSILKSIKFDEIEEGNIGSLEDLSPTDYLVDKTASPEMSYQDVLIIAMKKEERSRNLYEDLYKKTTDKKLLKIFKLLANEEIRHRNFFESMYEKDIINDN